MENGKCVLCSNPVGDNDEGLCNECYTCLEPTYQFNGNGVICPEGK